MVAGLSREEKLSFSLEMRKQVKAPSFPALVAEDGSHFRDPRPTMRSNARARLSQGNESYAEKDYAKATELYMQSLVGLDYGDDAESREEAKKTVQVPVLTNLAICFLHQRQFHKCVALCGSALQLDPKAWKALTRRGIARMELGDYCAARLDLREAAACAPSEGDRKAVQRELRRLQGEEKKEKEAVAKQRGAFSRAMVGKLSSLCPGGWPATHHLRALTLLSHVFHSTGRRWHGFVQRREEEEGIEPWGGGVAAVHGRG